MSTVRRIVVDTDTGIDDAHTLLYLAGRADAEIVAITSVYGNCAEEDAARNIGYVTGLLGLDVPVFRGADKPLEGAPHIAGYVHGHDGLGDRGYDRPPPRTGGETAAEALVRLGREHPGELDLLALDEDTPRVVGVPLERTRLLVLTVAALLAVGDGRGPAEPGTFWGYLITLLCLPPLAAVLARMEPTRWGSVIVLVVCLVMPVLVVRLGQTWAVTGG